MTFYRAIFFSILLICNLAHAKDLSNTVLVDHTLKNINPGKQLFVYEQTETKLMDIEKALGFSQEDWAHIPGNEANFGFSSSTFWLLFDTENISDNSIQLFLHINYALLDQIEFFAFSKGDRSFKQDEYYNVGDLQPYYDRPIDFPTFLLPFEIKGKETKRIILKVNTSGSMQLPITLWQREAFLLESQDTSFLYGCFIASLLVMAAYYLCLFFMVRDRNYLLYSGYIISMLGVHTSLDGYAYKWFWPSFVNWHQISAVTFISIGLVTAILFTRMILPIPNKSRLDKFTLGLSVIASISALISLFLPYQKAAVLNGLMTVIVMSGVAITCILMLKHSPRIARFFCFAWSAYFFGILLKSTTKLGYLPSNTLTEYSGNLGAVIGIVIIALALADRINREKYEKEKAQEQSIRNLKRFETLYDNALEGIFSFSEDGRLISANPAFLKLIGLNNIENFDGNWGSLSGYILDEKHFNDLLLAVKKNGQVLDYESKMIDKKGAYIWVNISARYIESEPSNLVEGTLINISERKAFEEQLQHLAEHDSLTGFYNRRAFENTAKQLLKKSQNYEEKSCLLYMDLDQFKIVNDLCGHTAGDVLLKNLSQKLLEQVKTFGKDQVIARLGGDEFGILLSHTSLPKARVFAEKLRQTVEDFLFIWEGKRYSVGVSIGLVEILPYHQSVEQILVMADTACYMAKDSGRNRVHTFIESDKEMQFRQLEMQWVSNIKEAIEQDQFFLVFQNIEKNHEKEPRYHYEILLRLINSQGNLCAPNQFLPAAERYNLMPNIDRWVVKQYFGWLMSNPEHLNQLSCASLNLSTQSIGDESFSKFLLSAFQEYGVPANKICFEITEGMAITHLENTQSFIERFRSLGCRFALDDFGTGFSSYAYLKDLNVDYLKIDGVFIKNLCDDQVNIAMVKSISDVASAIGIQTVAEFVENKAIQDKLTEIGITYSQGYHIHKPVKLDLNAFELKANEQ